MDPAAQHASLSSLLRRRLRPAILVLSSEGSEQIARKNGLTVADLVRPFASLKEMSYPFRSPAVGGGGVGGGGGGGGTNITTLTEVSLRVVTPSELALPPLDLAEMALARAAAAPTGAAGGSAASAAGPGYSDATLGTPEDAARWLAKATKVPKGGGAATAATDGLSPGFAAWRAETLTRSPLRGLPQEQYDAPVAILIVSSTLDTSPSPVAAAKELASQNALPDQFRGQFDPAIPRFVLLLHDVGSSATQPAADGSAGAPGKFSYSNEAAATATTTSFPFTSPLHGRAPADPAATMRELRSSFPPASVFGVALNSDAAGAGSGAPASLWEGGGPGGLSGGGGIDEPLLLWPKALPVVPLLLQQQQAGAASSLSPAGPATPVKGGGYTMGGAGGSSLDIDLRAASGPLPMRRLTAAMAPPASSSQLLLPPSPPSVAESLLACAIAPRRGCCLGADDVNGLRAVLFRMVTEGILPALESRVVNLHALAAKSGGRGGGLRSKVMSWLGGGGGPGTGAGAASSSGSAPGGAGTPSGFSGTLVGSGEDAVLALDVTTVLYPYGSTEASARTLADLLLMVGDYDGASAAYRAVREDYRADRAASYYAAACEGIAVCSILRGDAFGGALLGAGGLTAAAATAAATASREVEAMLETACASYYKAAQAAVSGQVSSTAGSAVAALMASPGPASAGVGGGAAAQGGASSLLSSPAAGGAATPSSSDAASPAQVAKRLAIRLATRASLLSADVTQIYAASVLPTGAAAAAVNGTGNASFQAANARLREAAGILRRAALAEGEGTLAAALLTEQAAYMCLRCAPPCARRAGHHLATAGTGYASCGQARHAVRCLSAALTVYGRPVGPGGPPPGGFSGWALIGDHLYLHLAQRLAAVGDAGAATSFLARVLAFGASRLAASQQRGVLREFGRVYTIWCERKRGEVGRKTALALVKKGAADAALFPGGANDPLPLSALPADDAAAAAAEAEKATELAGAGLPFVDDASVQIVSWGNAWTAALAVAQAWNGMQGDPAARSTGGGGDAGGGSAPAAAAANSSGAAGVCRPLSSCRVPSLPGLASAPSAFFSKDAASLSPLSAYLAEVGSGDGAVPGEGLWDGHLPGEGPVRDSESASSTGRGAWARILEAVARDVKTRDKLGGGIFADALGAGAASGTGAPAAAPLDWTKLCADIAIAQEDEAESAAKAHRAVPATRPRFGDGEDEDEEGDDDAAAGDDGQALSEGIDIPLDAVLVPTGPTAARLLSAQQSAAMAAQAAASGGVASASGGSSAAAPGGSAPGLAGSAFAAVARSTGIRTAHAFHPADVVSKSLERHAGEPLAVLVAVTNPLGVEMPLVGVRLVVDWQQAGAGTAESEHAGSGDAAWLVDDADAAPSPSSSLSPSAPTSPASLLPSGAALFTRSGVAVLPVDVLLAPGETRLLHLLARPLRAGTLVVKGVAWSLGGLVRCRHDFDLRGPPLNDNRTNRASGARATDRRTEARVKPAREWAGVRVTGLCGGAPALVSVAEGGGMSASAGASSSLPPLATFPVLAAPPGGATATVMSSGGGPPIPAGPPLPLHLPLAAPAILLDGEVRTCAVELTNVGAGPITTVLLQPQPAVGGRVQVWAEGSSLDGLDGTTLVLQLSRASLLRADGTVRRQPSDDPAAAAHALLPGETARWPLFVRGCRPGRHALRVGILYGSLPQGDASSSSSSSSSSFPVSAKTLPQLRVLRWCARVRVIPSLVTRATLAPSRTAAGEYELRVGVTHVEGLPPVLPVAGAGAGGPPGGGAASGLAPQRGGIVAPPQLPSAVISPAASAVPLPLALAAVTSVSDAWRIDLVREEAPLAGDKPAALAAFPGASAAAALFPGSESAFVAAAAASASSASAPSPFGRPLAFFESRAFVFRVHPAKPHPTSVLAPGASSSEGAVQIAPPAAADVTSSSSPGGVPLPNADAMLMRLSLAHRTVFGTIRDARKKEHERRRAAEAADALPPTLRSIRLAKQGGAGGEDGDGDGDEEEEEQEPAAAPLPASTQALTLGRAALSVVVSWTRAGAGGDAQPRSGRLFIHRLAVGGGVGGGAGAGASGLVRAGAGAVPAWIARDAARLAALAAAAGGAGAQQQRGQPQLMQAPRAGVPSRPGGAPRPGQPPAAAHAAPFLPLVATLDAPSSPVAIGGGGATLPLLLAVYNAGPAGSRPITFDVLLTGGAAAPAPESHDGAAEGTSSTGGAGAYAPLPVSPLVWLGPSSVRVTALRPGHRVAVPLSALVTEPGVQDLANAVYVRPMGAAAAAAAAALGGGLVGPVRLLRAPVLVTVGER
jgi:hypothetical protein